MRLVWQQLRLTVDDRGAVDNLAMQSFVLTVQ